MQGQAAREPPERRKVNTLADENSVAVAQVIRFMAVLLPWLIIIVPGLILVRAISRWEGRDKGP